MGVKQRTRPGQAVLGDATEHYWRVNRMAKITETDLVAAMERARLSSEDWAEMVERCRGCGWGDDCETWLDSQMGPAESPPGACANRAKFRALKQALKKIEEGEA